MKNLREVATAQKLINKDVSRQPNQISAAAADGNCGLQAVKHLPLQSGDSFQTAEWFDVNNSKDLTDLVNIRADSAKNASIYLSLQQKLATVADDIVILSERVAQFFKKLSTEIETNSTILHELTPTKDKMELIAKVPLLGKRKAQEQVSKAAADEEEMELINTSSITDNRKAEYAVVNNYDINPEQNGASTLNRRKTKAQSKQQVKQGQEETSIPVAAYDKSTPLGRLKQKLEAKLSVQDKHLVNNLQESFVNSIVANRIKGKESFFRYIQSTKGIEQLHTILIKAVAYEFISSILSGCGNTAAVNFNELFEVLFTKNGNEYTKSNEFEALLSVFKLKNISSIFHKARKNAATEILSFTRSIFVTDTDGNLVKNSGEYVQNAWFKTLLEFMSTDNMASMLHSAAQNSKKELKGISAKATLEMVRNKMLIKVEEGYEASILLKNLQQALGTSGFASIMNGAGKEFSSVVDQLANKLFIKDAAGNYILDATENYIISPLITKLQQVLGASGFTSVMNGAGKKFSLVVDELADKILIKEGTRYYTVAPLITKLQQVLGVSGFTSIIGAAGKKFSLVVDQLANKILIKDAEGNYTTSPLIIKLQQTLGAKGFASIMNGAGKEFSSAVDQLVNKILIKDAEGNYTISPLIIVLQKVLGIGGFTSITTGCGKEFNLVVDKLAEKILIKDNDGKYKVDAKGNYITSSLIAELQKALGVRGFTSIMNGIGQEFSSAVDRLVNKILIKDAKGNYTISPLIIILQKVLGIGGFTSIATGCGKEFSLVVDKLAEKILIKDDAGKYKVDAKGDYIISALITELQKALGARVFTSIMSGAGKEFSSAVDQLANKILIKDDDGKYKVDAKRNYTISPLFTKLQKVLGVSGPTYIMSGAYNKFESMVNSLDAIINLEEWQQLSLNQRNSNLLKILYDNSKNSISDVQKLLKVINNNDLTKLTEYDLTADSILSSIVNSNNIQDIGEICNKLQKVLYIINEPNLQCALKYYYFHCLAFEKIIIKKDVNPATKLFNSLKYYISASTLPNQEKQKVSEMQLEYIYHNGKKIQQLYIEQVISKSSRQVMIDKEMIQPPLDKYASQTEIAGALVNELIEYEV